MGYYADLSLTFTPDSGKCTDIFPSGAPSKFAQGARENFIALHLDFIALHLDF